MPTPTIHHFRKTFVASLWLGVLGSPIVWAIHLQLLYLLVVVAARTDRYIWFYVTTAVCFLLAIGCGLLSWRDWRSIQRDSPNQRADDTQSGDAAGRTRFLSIMGIFLSGFFAIVILATGLTVYFFRATWV